MEGPVPIIDNFSESLTLEDIDHILVPFDKIVTDSKLTFMVLSALLILLTNAVLIRLILKKVSRTFLDNLMILDSGFCICNIYSISVMSNLIKLCEFSVPFIFTLSTFNRNVSFVIPLYRYIYVVRHYLLDSLRKRKTFEMMLISGIVANTVGSALGIFHYRELYLPYKSKMRIIELITLGKNSRVQDWQKPFVLVHMYA